MRANYALLMTDLVDSTALTERMGEDASAALWLIHDRIARDLLRQSSGREVDRTDGFFFLFDSVDDAVAHALAYQRAVRDLDPPLSARAGVHYGPILFRENVEADVTRGAKRFETDGIAIATVARVMSTAQGGQTLLTASARAELRTDRCRVQSHGSWRVKGVSEPMELYEVGAADAPFTPPPDSVKAYRVVRTGDGWLSAVDLPNNLPAERDQFIGRQLPLQTLVQHSTRAHGSSRFTARAASARRDSLCGMRASGWASIPEVHGSVIFRKLRASMGSRTPSETRSMSLWASPSRSGNWGWPSPAASPAW